MGLGRDPRATDAEHQDRQGSTLSAISTPLAKDIGFAVLLSLGATLLTLCVTLLFAVLFHDLFGQSLEQTLLAYAPAGWLR